MCVYIYIGYCLWIISIIWLYKALNRTPNIDCYWVGAVPNRYTCMCLGAQGFGVEGRGLGVWFRALDFGAAAAILWSVVFSVREASTTSKCLGVP